MAVKLEFINLIVPVEAIRAKLGEQAFEEQFSGITEITWHDGYLWRDGCMNELNLSEMLDEWEEWGFNLIKIVDGQKCWDEVCVVYSHHGPSYPCEWIEYDAEKNIAWLKGGEPGAAVGPVGRNVAGEDAEGS